MKKDEAIKFVVVNGLNLGELSDELRGDKEVVMEAVKNWGGALGLASNELRSDKEVVLAAVKQHGEALEYAGDGLRGDREVVLLVVKIYGRALKYASDELRGDKEVVMEAIEQNCIAYKFCVKDMQVDKDVILLANKKLLKHKSTVDDFLCDDLIELKRKYGVSKLEMALEMDKKEVDNFTNIRPVVSIIKKRT